MGCSREGFDLFTKYGRQHFFKSWNWHYMWGDTFNQIICIFKGHIKYDAGEGDYACRRCYKYIGHYDYNPPEEIGLVKKHV